MLLTYRLVLYLGGRRAALVAGIVLITSFQFLYLHSAQDRRTGTHGLPTTRFVRTSLSSVTIDEPFSALVASPPFARGSFQSQSAHRGHPRSRRTDCFRSDRQRKASAGRMVGLGMRGSARRRSLAWLPGLPVSRPGAQRIHCSRAPDGRGFRGRPERAEFLGRTLYYGQRDCFSASFPYAPDLPPRSHRRWKSKLLPSSDADVTEDGVENAVLLVYLLTIFAFYLGISKVGPWYIVHAYPFLAALVGLYLGGRARSGVTTHGINSPCGASVLSLLFWVTPEIASYNPFLRRRLRDSHVDLNGAQSPAISPEWGVPSFGPGDFRRPHGVEEASAKEGLSDESRPHALRSLHRLRGHPLPCPSGLHPPPLAHRRTRR